MASTAELRKALQAEVAKVERGEKALKENKEEMDVKYLGLGDLWRSTPSMSSCVLIIVLLMYYVYMFFS